MHTPPLFRIAFRLIKQWGIHTGRGIPGSMKIIRHEIQFVQYFGDGDHVRIGNVGRSTGQRGGESVAFVSFGTEIVKGLANGAE